MNGFNFSDFLTKMAGQTQLPAMMQGDFSGLKENMGPAFTASVKSLGDDPSSALRYLDAQKRRMRAKEERFGETSPAYDAKKQEEERRKLAQQKAVKEMMAQMMKNQGQSRVKGGGPAFQYGRHNPMSYRGGLG